ncbi:uncharacterized protein [Haliotis cracherodii]|uniref:uncharacterized protein n=1 Tax=Haliotis cracherodii TaxID=6455 RepID=UPI0039ECAC98
MYFIVKFSAFAKVLLIATVVSGSRIRGNVTVTENDRNQSTQTTFERSGTEHVFGTRPLLADDVVHDDEDMDIINVSRNFFRSTGDISEKMNIIKKYKQLVIDSINMKKETIVAEKDKKSSKHYMEKDAVLDEIWNMYTKGFLVNNLKDPTMSVTGEPVDYWDVMKGEVLPGSILEIGGCQVALKAARQNQKRTSISVLLKHDGVEGVRCSCSNKDVHNLYEAASTPSLTQAYVQDLYSDYKILFSNIVLTNFTSLSYNLLPHEYVGLLAMVFSMAKKIFIPGFSLSKSQEMYFTSQWGTPGELFKEACGQGGLVCEVETGWGYDGWAADRGVHRVTVTWGRRPLPRHVCLKMSQSRVCYSSYNANMTLLFGDGTNTTSPLHANEVHLKSLLRMGLTKDTRDRLFVRMLHMPHQGQRTQDMVVSGDKLTSIKLTHRKKHQVIKTSPNLGKVKSSPQDEIKVLTLRQGSRDSHSEDTPTNWDREDGGIGMQSVQWGRVWDRESSDTNNHQGELRDGSQSMDREVKGPEDSGRKLNGDDGSESKKMTDEEKQIHKGLDYLQSRNSVSDKVIVKESVSNMAATGKSVHTVRNDSEKHESKEKTEFSRVDSKNVMKMPTRIVQKPGHLVKRSSILKSFIRQKLVSGSNIPSKSQNGSHSTSFTSKQNLRLRRKIRKKRFPVDTGSQVEPEKPKTVLLHDTGKLLNVLTNRGRGRNNTRGYEISPNQRKVLSYSPDSSYSSRDAYKHYTRPRSSPAAKTHVQPEWSFKQPMVTEEMVYDGQWKAVKSYIADVGILGINFSLFIYGRKPESLIGGKVAMLYPQSRVVTVIPPAHATLVEPHRKFISSLPHENSLVFCQDLSPALVKDMYTMPEMFKFQVLGLDVFHHMLALGDTYLYYLGQILTMAETTFLEIPHFDQLTLAQAVFSDRTSPVQAQGLIVDALALVGAEAESLQILKVVVQEEVHSLIIRIRLRSMQRKVEVGCDRTPGTLTLLPDCAVSLHMEAIDTFYTVSRTKVSVCLDLLLRLDPQPQERAMLFQKYLKLSIFPDMCPAHLVWGGHQLMYQPVMEEVKPVLLHTQGGARESDMTQRTTTLLVQEMERGSFSFLDYNSKDNIGVQLAPQYPNSTFVSLVSEADTATTLLQEVQEQNITNMVVNVMPLDTTLVTKLMKCPDFLRYQYLGYDEILGLMNRVMRPSFDLLIGQVIATGVTSFIQVPSGKILSLAAATFYREEFLHQDQQETGNNLSHLFHAERHPVTQFHNVENQFLFQSAKADVDIEVAAKILSPQMLSDGAQLPWKLVRVDIKQLKLKVDHHFDYNLDGHSRKYTLHCIGHNSSSYSVYLVRNTDGFKIPYGTVNAVSLIALLRMGLVSPIKEKFYSEFLQLPLYEDMAPWNIVFRAGRLEYIDYDSRDLTFNKMSSAAYQIMAMLMNFKRTVDDFGHCKSDAKTPYGFNLVSRCVGSDFKGPCTDTKYPVPCGDHTCRATYIDCLQALQAFEQGRSTGLQQESAKRQKVEDIESMQWRFDEKGPSI